MVLSLRLYREEKSSSQLNKEAEYEKYDSKEFSLTQRKNSNKRKGNSHGQIKTQVEYDSF